jgi:hypothetical protein
MTLPTPARPTRAPRGRGRLLLSLGMIFVTPLAAELLPIDNDAATSRELVSSGQALPLQQIIDHARGLRPGRLIDAELYRSRGDGRLVYEIYILDGSGDVWELEYDAASGSLIEHEQEDH